MWRMTNGSDPLPIDSSFDLSVNTTHFETHLLLHLEHIRLVSLNPSTSTSRGPFVQVEEVILLALSKVRKF